MSLFNWKKSPQYNVLHSTHFKMGLFTVVYALDCALPFSKAVEEDLFFNEDKFDDIFDKIFESNHGEGLEFTAAEELSIYACLHFYCILLRSDLYEEFIKQYIKSYNYAKRTQLLSYSGRRNNYRITRELMEEFEIRLIKSNDFIKQKKLLEEMFPNEGLF